MLNVGHDSSVHQACCPVRMTRTVHCTSFLVVSSCVAPASSDVLSSYCTLVVLRCVVNLVSSMQLLRFCLFLLDVFFIDNSTVQENLKYK